MATPPPPPPLRSPAAANGAKANASIHCRACWRDLDAANALRLPCGDVFCAACLADVARAALATPLARLPVRCCWAPVPAALLRKVLAPPELAFYAFQTRQRVDAMRNKISRDGVDRVTPCDFCLVPTRLATLQHAHERLLDCGHVYCAECIATMKQSRGTDSAVCCRELTDLLPVIQAPDAHASRAPPVDPQAALAQRRTSARRVVFAPLPPPIEQKGKGKRKLQVAPADANVVDLLDDSDDEDGNTHDHTLDADDDDVEVCVKCAGPVHVATNRFRAACGHVFCRACLHDRCLRALRNEEQGSIGFPVRCCNALVSLELLRAILSKRNFTKYEALVAKRGDTAIPTPPRTTRKRKAAAAATADANKRTKTGGGEDDDTPAECVACMASVDEAKDRLKGPCGHVYCVTCLAMMAKQSLEDRALVPIRCCAQEFPIDYVKRVLTKTQYTQYERFLKEKDWRTSDLKSDKEYAAMVKSINGKQCPTCGVGVQKISGCDAMRCIRGHLFCFACEGAPCTCGRTRLESYGWVPPGTQPNPHNQPHGAIARVLFGGVHAGFADAVAAANARMAGLMAQAMGRPRGVGGGLVDALDAVIRGHAAPMPAVAAQGRAAPVPGGVMVPRFPEAPVARGRADFLAGVMVPAARAVRGRAQPPVAGAGVVDAARGRVAPAAAAARPRPKSTRRRS